MATPIYRLQRELAYAQARAAYYAAFTPSTTLGPAREMESYVYFSLLLKDGASQTSFNLQASKASVDFFVATTLGLSVTAEDKAAAKPKPRGFKPSMIKAMIASTTRVKTKAFGDTGRPYIRYSKNTEGDAQANYSAPVCKKSATPTYADLQAALTAIKTAKAGDFTTYSRIYLINERLSATA